MTIETELKQLNAKRGALRAQLTNFDKFLKAINVEQLTKDVITNLEQRIDRIEPVHDSFLEIQTAIEELKNYEINSDERDEFENFYFDIISKAKTIVSDYYDRVTLSNEIPEQNIENGIEQQAGSTVSRDRVLQRVANVKLPKIELPFFDGTFTKWREFSDVFKAIVHGNDELSDCQKLCCLKSDLKGEASNTIRSLATTDDNYLRAWESLFKRYENKRRIVDTHVKTIINLEISNKESHTALRSFIDDLENNMLCLKALNQQTDQWNALLIPILLNKLDCNTVKEWESKLNKTDNNNEIPEYSEFKKILETKQKILEAVSYRTNSASTSQNINSKNVTKLERRSQNGHSLSATNVICAYCEKNHSIQSCDTFLKLNVSERSQRAKELKLCLNCLRKGHFIPDCKSSNCKTCNKKHNTLLHINFNESKVNITINGITDMTSNSLSSINHNHVLLSTIKVNATDYQGKTHSLSLLLDSGSQSNYITKKSAKALRLKLDSASMLVTGINQVTTKISKQTKVNISSKHYNFGLEINCFVLPTITGCLPTTSLNISECEIPPNIQLADDTFYKSSEIDMLIGVSHFYGLLGVGQFRNNQGLLFQKTKFGWIVSGTLSQTNQNQVVSMVSLNSLHEDLKLFWKLDNFDEKTNILTMEQKLSETLFKNTTTRAPDGKFIVSLPLKDDLTMLGDSGEIARNRFFHLESKFRQNKEFKEKYCNVIYDYLHQGHMSLTKPNINDEFYLPHHAVMKESSDTTKCRVVFDGSCQLTSGVPINSLQLVGPTIQDDLFSILSRFRIFQFVLSGDITQMYRQIWVHPEYRRYQKILWRDNEKKELQTFKLNTVTFGTSAAPFLAIRCLKEIADLNVSLYPTESEVIARDFYVDDVLTGTNTSEGFKQIKTNLINILSQAQFKLTKFRSIVPELNDTLGNQIFNTRDNSPKVLGTKWNPTTDSFLFSIDKLKDHNKVTKRSILSLVAQLLDPIGLLSPIFITPKLIIQELWQMKIEWDETIPVNMHYAFTKFKDDLKVINQISIPRCVIIQDSILIEIHAFSDASEKAYGTCVYLKSTNSYNNSISYLIASKSRVTPLKRLSIPKLELLAAVLIIQLVNKLKECLHLQFSAEYYWSDSSIVLHWLQASPNKWTTFVANRVSLIQEMSEISNWRHLNTLDNPADLVSRGKLPSELKENELWWHGPNWLVLKDSQWPESKVKLIEVPEQKMSISTSLVCTITEDLSENILIFVD